ncbi:MAG: type VI secretion system baseplate subunit TssE [Phycisphaerae bacterium]
MPGDDVASRDRLMPFLLDRLADDHPDTQVESRTARTTTITQLRSAVLRDIGWLLNSTRHPDSDGFNAHPLVARSVLNFGIPAMGGTTESSVSVEYLEHVIADAIRTYEPRLLPETVIVKATSGARGVAGNRVDFEIRADLWAVPMPDVLFVRTEVDLETGLCQVTQRSNG